MSQKSNRLLAVRALISLVSENGSLSSLLPGLERDHPDANHALVREYCFGVCRWFHRLQAIASGLMDKPLRKRDTDIQCLILLGLYQLLYMRTPDHAVINETVSVTGQLQKDWARGLVNAVLRRALREPALLEQLSRATPEAEFSHPAWLIAALREDWPEQADSVMASNNTQAPMTLRVNTCQVSRDNYLDRLRKSGFGAGPGVHATSAIVMENAVPVALLPGFADGLVSVQDEASQLVTGMLKLTPASRVLDACAAPGGKTCALLEASNNRLDLTALDNNESRLVRVRDNLARLQLEATVVCADAGDPAAWWDGKPFDAILLDAPCSGTGVIRRHPDIKLLRAVDAVARMRSLQHALLDALWPCLASGGSLLYSTCSVLRDENERQIDSFLARTPDAAHVPLAHNDAVICNAGLQFLPEAGGIDGFYYALLAKS